MNSILRMAAVQSAAAGQLENSKRLNISGISALTGIPRGEVSRILTSSRSSTIGAVQGRQNVTSRILSAWHSDSNYLTATRRPRDLKIFGRGSTFESLVSAYGRGIPIRAILDELKRVGAIQFTSSQKIRPKMPLAINSQITHKKIRDIDGAINDTFLFLLRPSGVAFKEVSGIKRWSGCVPQARTKFGPNATALLRKLQASLGRSQVKQRPDDVQKMAHSSVKIVYRETYNQLAKDSFMSRQNLRRKG